MQQEGSKIAWMENWRGGGGDDQIKEDLVGEFDVHTNIW